VVDEEAEDVFDGREFMNVPLVVRCSPCRSSETTALSTHTPFLVSSPTSASASPPTTTTTTTTVDRPHPNSYARRSIVAKGQKRFEGISKIAPPQPSIERLSPRVINVLGMNPAPYTLNGTNCYVVGTGPKRILIDTGNPSAAELMFPFGRQDAHEVFVKNLAELMQEEQFDIELILLTHLHFDHFGGWWWWLGMDCWVARRNNCFLAATVVEDVVHGWDGCFTQFKAEQTHDVERDPPPWNWMRWIMDYTTLFDGGTHERDTKGMGECSNTLQGHNNNFFFLLWWCNTLKGVSLSMLFFFRRTITFGRARSKCFALVPHNARYRPSVIRGSSFFFVFWGSFHVDFKG